MLVQQGAELLPEQRDLVSELGLTDALIQPPPLSRPALAALYHRAELVLLTSEREGFGLPIVEAMACGTPVLTSNITAMPEIAGDAALLVDPRSVEQIARGTEQIVSLSFLRQDLRTKGLERAAQFSWARTSARARDVIAAPVRTCAEG